MRSANTGVEKDGGTINNSIDKEAVFYMILSLVEACEKRAIA